MHIGLIGLGRIGMLFGQIITNEHDAVSLHIFSPRKHRRFSSLIKKERTTFSTDWDKFYSTDLDGYIIASPSDTHEAYVKKLAARGKPIFCEKPLELSVPKIHRINKIVKAHDVILTVGFNRRFDPDVIHLKKQLMQGTIGKPHVIKITSRDPAPPSLDFIRSSGGLFLDMVIHDFDMARHLLDDDPISIFTEAEVMVDRKIGALGDVDTAVSTLKFEKGPIVVIDNSRKAVYGYDQRIEIFGSKGMLSMKNQRDHNVIKHSEIGSQMEPYKDFFMQRYHSSYINEMAAFLKICQGKKGRTVSGHDALMATKIAIAALRSATTGRRIKIK